jgi:hypothetical protein
MAAQSADPAMLWGKSSVLQTKSADLQTWCDLVDLHPEALGSSLVMSVSAGLGKEAATWIGLLIWFGLALLPTSKVAVKTNHIVASSLFL